jgi:thiaminase
VASAVLISTNLHSLCTGWLEFPQTQVTLPRIKINVENKKTMKFLEELTGKWSQKHAKTTTDILASAITNSAKERYESLKQIFVGSPEKAFP